MSGFDVCSRLTSREEHLCEPINVRTSMNLSMEGKAMTKNVANPEDKDEVWKKSGFAGRVQSLRENGLDKEAVVEIVGTCVDYFGQEYADAILERLRNAYGARGEEIVIQRRP